MRTVYKILSLALLLALLEYNIIPKSKFSFVCNDPKISHPFQGDTVSPGQLLTTAFLGPLVILTLIEVSKGISFRHINKTGVWTLYKKCATGSVIVILVTELIKSVVSEARPHFLDSCKPDVCKSGDVVSEFSCSNTQLGRFHTNDLTKSFPSGHASLSIFVSLYCSVLVLLRVPSDTNKRTLIKVFLITLCVGWGLLCSVSRIADKRHFWWDVLAGAIVGSCSALYSLYFLPRDEVMMKCDGADRLLESSDEIR